MTADAHVNGTEAIRRADGRPVCRQEPGAMLNAVMSSLAAFLAAGVRPPTPLAKAITLVLVLKLLAITGASIALLSIKRSPIDPGAVARLIGPSTPSPDEGRR